MPIDFTVEPIDEMPKKINRGGRKSKYEPILTAFLESGHKLVRVDNTGKEANYLAMILNKLAKKKGVEIKALVRNGTVFLEAI